VSQGSATGAYSPLRAATKPSFVLMDVDGSRVRGARSHRGGLVGLVWLSQTPRLLTHIAPSVGCLCVPAGRWGGQGRQGASFRTHSRPLSAHTAEYSLHLPDRLSTSSQLLRSRCPAVLNKTHKSPTRANDVRSLHTSLCLAKASLCTQCRLRPRFMAAIALRVRGSACHATCAPPLPRRLPRL
jgi:hypothetical protein